MIFVVFICCLVLAALLSEWLVLAFVMFSLTNLGGTIFCAVLATVSALLALRMVRRSAWLPMLVACAVFVCALSFAAAPTRTESTLVYVARSAHFGLLFPFYRMQVRSTPTSEPRIQEFNWGGMLFASYGAVYDETDEIGAKMQSGAWLKRMHNSDVTCGEDHPVAEVRHMIGHFYLTGFGC